MAQQHLTTDPQTVLPEHIVEHPDFPSESICPPDVLIRVPRETDASGNTSYMDFYCHKNLLAFASEGFKSALCGGWKESHDPQSLKGGRHGQIEPGSTELTSPSGHTADAATSEDSTVIRLNDLNLSGSLVLKEDDVTAVEQFLRLIYPHLEHRVTWANCEALTCFADKWEVPLLFKACKKFLCSAVAEKPLLAVVIAERYEWEQLYEQAAGLTSLAWPPAEAEATRGLELSPQTLHKIWQMHRRALSLLCSRLCRDEWPLAKASHGTGQACSSCASKIETTWIASLGKIAARASWVFDDIVREALALNDGKCGTWRSCSNSSNCLEIYRTMLIKDLETLLGIKLPHRY